jgi:hypothetical protein
MKAKEIKKMITEVEEMVQEAYDSVLSRNNVEIHGILCSNLGEIRRLQSKYNVLIMRNDDDSTKIYNEIEELYNQSQKAIKKLK